MNEENRINNTEVTGEAVATNENNSAEDTAASVAQVNNDVLKQREERRKSASVFRLCILTFFLIIGFLSVYGFAIPDRQFSENENRVLEQAPVITPQSLLDGSFMKKCETYLTDQFPLRDEAIYVKSYIERFLGKTKENGAYIGKKGFLFDQQSSFNKTKMAELAKTVNTLSKKNPQLNVTFALIPNSSCVYSDFLPDYLQFKDQNSQIQTFYSYLDKSINKLDAYSVLNKAKNSQQVFYKTDHHWTTRGAYAVFKHLAKPLNLQADEKYRFYCVSNDFRGTLASKVSSVKSVDSVEICFSEALQNNFFIDFYGEKEKSATFFFKQELEEKDKYEVFFGGNYGKFSITTRLFDANKLIIIKDSYANCLIPMLAPYYSKILVLDPRYMTESVGDMLKTDEYTDILFLYNANTLFEDVSLKTVLE